MIITVIVIITIIMIIMITTTVIIIIIIIIIITTKIITIIMPESLFHKVAGLRIEILLNKRFWQSCFPRILPNFYKHLF